MLLVFIVTGCAPLAPGNLDAIRAAPEPSSGAEIYLIRGWRDLYSTGVDRLGDELRQAGFKAEVFREEQWRNVASALADRYRASSAPRPLILIGFSYGADDAISICRQLASARVDVDLLITIDPVTPPAVPSNVRICYNFFQTNGIWDLFPWLRGVGLKAAAGEGPMLVNVDIRRDRPDLLESDTSHANIAANPKLHREIVERVIEAAAAPGKN